MARYYSAFPDPDAECPPVKGCWEYVRLVAGGFFSFFCPWKSILSRSDQSVLSRRLVFFITVVQLKAIYVRNRSFSKTMVMKWCYCSLTQALFTGHPPKSICFGRDIFFHRRKCHSRVFSKFQLLQHKSYISVDSCPQIFEGNFFFGGIDSPPVVPASTLVAIATTTAVSGQSLFVFCLLTRPRSSRRHLACSRPPPAYFMAPV